MVHRTFPMLRGLLALLAVVSIAAVAWIEVDLAVGRNHAFRTLRTDRAREGSADRQAGRRAYRRLDTRQVAALRDAVPSPAAA